MNGKKVELSIISFWIKRMKNEGGVGVHVHVHVHPHAPCQNLNSKYGKLVITYIFFLFDLIPKLQPFWVCMH